MREGPLSTVLDHGDIERNDSQSHPQKLTLVVESDSLIENNSNTKWLIPKIIPLIVDMFQLFLCVRYLYTVKCHP